LIRYDTGDLVRSATPCACGRSHQSIERGAGRPSNLFHLPNRKWFRPKIGAEVMENLLGDAKWQLVQIGVSGFELRYMPTNSNSPIDESKIRTTIKNALAANVSVNVKAFPALGLASSGKFLTTLNQSYT
jgi:phenylacetate-coenzyme A ligase PaaK-like adenylate-forming protein